MTFGRLIAPAYRRRRPSILETWRELLAAAPATPPRESYPVRRAAS